VPAHDLIRAVTADAARALRLRHVGALVEGAPADVAVFPAGSAGPFDAVLAARRADVRLVLLDGRPLAGDPDFADVFDATRTGATRVRLDGRVKLLASTIARQARRAAIREPGLEVAA
jgi:cytosine/adenosine deaminase-related metal-dependent hydrolase